MRLIARRAAAVIAIVLGLACVSAAALGSDSSPIGRPPVPDDEPRVGAIPPLNPRTTPARPKPKPPSSFDTEFGDRGSHEVTVTIRGSAHYLVNWRDKESKIGVGNVTQSRTIEGGFPLAQVAMQAVRGNSTCTITIDGDVKDTQSTTAETPIAYCEA
jgi:hypothetical protein